MGLMLLVLVLEPAEREASVEVLGVLGEMEDLVHHLLYLQWPIMLTTMSEEKLFFFCLIYATTHPNDPYYQIYEEESGTYDKFSKPFYPKVLLWDCKPFANLDNDESGDDDYQQNNYDEMIQC